MTTERRLLLLKIGVGGMAGLFLFNLMVIEPFTASWNDQSARIKTLSDKVQRGKNLIGREDTIRTQWADMVRANLPQEVAAAENQAFRAVSRWEADSQIVFSSIDKQWQTHEEGYKTLECRIAADGNQATIGRLIYDIETDHAPVNLEEVEITTHDAQGTQLMLTARFSFLQLAETGRNAK